MVAYFLDFLRKGRPHHEAQCLLELGFGPLFLLGRGLPLKCDSLAAGASVLGQLVGWPNSFTLAAFRGEFFRESSHPPTPSIRLMAGPFPRGEWGCAEGLGSRGECVEDEQFSNPYRDAIDTSFSLGMECSECIRIPNCRIPCRPLPPVCEAASIYEPHQGCLVARLGPGVNSREVGNFHMVLEWVRLEIPPLRVDPIGNYTSPSSRPSHDFETCVPGSSKLGCGWWIEMCGLVLLVSRTWRTF